MTRLYVLVEGQTEEEFAKNILSPHLLERKIYAYPIIVETSRDSFGRKRRGGGDWNKWLRDLKRLTGQHPGPDVRFTTLFDLYGLPKHFPGLEQHAGEKDTTRRAGLLEGSMFQAVNDWRLIPYLQRHEFEALVLASIEPLAGLLEDPGELEGITKLRALVKQVPPEEINDGETTAPSKRLESHIASYRKTVHGPLAVEGAGLGALRGACPRFDAWVSKLEQIGETQS